MTAIIYNKCCWTRQFNYLHKIKSFFPQCLDGLKMKKEIDWVEIYPKS